MRREHSREFKEQIIQLCREPGASVSGISLKYGLNANMVRKWIRPPKKAGGESENRTFISIPIVKDRTASPVRLEFHRNGSVVHLEWPHESRHECLHWLAEWMR